MHFLNTTFSPDLFASNCLEDNAFNLVRPYDSFPRNIYILSFSEEVAAESEPMLSTRLRAVRRIGVWWDDVETQSKPFLFCGGLRPLHPRVLESSSPTTMAQRRPLR